MVILGPLQFNGMIDAWTEYLLWRGCRTAPLNYPAGHASCWAMMTGGLARWFGLSGTTLMITTGASCLFR